MAVLPDHHYLMVIGERDDINPVPRFEDIEVMFDPCPRGDRGICPYRKNTKGLGRL